MDVLSQATVKGLLGSIDKATIFVPNLDGLAAWESKVSETSGLTGITTGEHMGTLQTSAEAILRRGAKDALVASEMERGVAQGLAGKGIKEASEMAAMATQAYSKVEVQYNPKTLSIIGLGGTARSYTAGLGMGAENQITQIKNDTSTTLSCELIFTHVNISDAFMSEDLMNMNINSAAGLAASGVNRLLGNSPSVQPLVDGFISILTRGYTRKILFAWGSTIFRGELTRVDSQYKMFNKRGDPIIATIGISIRQGFDDNQNYSEAHWKDSFNQTFKDIDNLL